MRLSVFFLVSFLLARSASAQTISLGFDAGYLIAGDSAVKGRKGNPTGGLALILVATASLPVHANVDVYYTQSPMIVAPTSVEQLGLVDANDFGVDVHTTNRALGISLAGTLAPSWMNWCNVQWCYKEFLLIGGGEAHLSLRISEDHGRALRLVLGGRLLYAKPTAWTWPALPAEDRRIITTIAMVRGGAEWSW